MKKLLWLAILMGVVLLAITGFQVYWLRDNYTREHRALEAKAKLLFRETIREVQDSIIQRKLFFTLADTGLKKVSNNAKPGSRRVSPRAARVLHLLGDQIDHDSAKKHKGVVIELKSNPAMRKNPAALQFDSLKPETIDEVLVTRTGDRLRQRERQGSDTHQFMMSRSRSIDSGDESFTEVSTVYLGTDKGGGVRISFDSLFNDPVRVDDLNKAFSKRLNEEKLDIPFSISKDTQAAEPVLKDFVRRPAKFANFEGYQLQLGNAFSYLVKKISLPILFSVFLVGITILSFVLLYRSLLRQHRLAEMKNDLISNITHELKTPIATVGVAIEALKNFNAMDDPARTREYLDISQNELQRLGLLVDKVLKLSMFENKEITLKKELFDLEEVVGEVVSSLRLQTEKIKASIQVNTEGNLLIKGDRLHLLSVVFNLLDNALKYNNGSVAITMDVKEEANDIVLTVSDNGIGIPQQYRHKIFEKFFRVPSGNTHNAKGHGLGLSYVAKVIDQHHGKIKVESQEGTGSSFIIHLPKADNHNRE